MKREEEVTDHLREQILGEVSASGSHTIDQWPLRMKGVIFLVSSG